jgi:hypothetical protein
MSESAERDPLAVTIGAREIYDQVVGLRADVNKLVDSHADTETTLDDHENRIRSLERWRYAVPTAAIGGLVAAGLSIARAMGG